ncbi:MAG: hypothetical protein HUU20_21390 [Pirellulales bacterium]|nr:hypothetical protein [Pirellulales bacterium]
MPIEFRCGKCGKLLRTADDTAGKQAKCPECGEVTTIPSPSALPPLPSSGQGSPFHTGSSPGASAGSPFGSGSQAAHAADEQNPYRSPSAFEPPSSARHGATPGYFAPTRIDLGDVLSRTWSIFKERIGICMGAFFLAFVINLVVGQILGYGATLLGEALNEEAIAVGLGLVANVAAQVFSLWLTLGQWLVFLRIARGQPVELGELFAGGPYLLRALGASVLFLLAVLAGVILLIVPGVIFALMFSQFLFLIIDRNTGVIESLELSKQVTSGNKLTLFALGFVIMGLGIVAVLPCGLGLLILWPFVSLLWPLTYLSMTGQPTAEQMQFQYQPA